MKEIPASRRICWLERPNWKEYADRTRRKKERKKVKGMFRKGGRRGSGEAGLV